MIIRKRLSADELFPVTQRYNADCDCTQSTPDGGTTWVDTPGIDPRTSVALQLPPFPSDSPQCDSAASIVANMKGGLDQALEQIGLVDTGATAATAILAWLEFITGIGLLISLITDLVLTIITIGIGAVDAAFTTEVYDELKCIFMCAALPDGSFNQASFDTIVGQVSDTFGEFSTVNVVTQGWLKFLGPVGLSNVASAKHVTGDCSDCDCGWCASFDFTISEQGWSIVTSPFTLATYTSDAGFGNIVAGCSYGDESCASLWITRSYDPAGDTSIISMEIFWTMPNDQPDYGAILHIGGGAWDFGAAIGSPSGFASHSGGDTGTTMELISGTNNTGGGINTDSWIISKIIIKGLGTFPFPGSPNC